MFPQDGATVIAFLCLASFCGIMMYLLDKNSTVDLGEVLGDIHVQFVALNN